MQEKNANEFLITYFFKMSVYDKKLDPSIRNEVVTATLRMGHSMVPHDLSMMRPDKSVYRRIRIKDNFFQVIEEIG